MTKSNASEDKASEDGLDAVDVHVGSRIRLRRTLLGLSQTELAEAVGLTFQQIQKYEKGGNRVAASRLWQFSYVLNVPILFFFEDMPEGGGSDGATEPGGSTGVMTKRETLELVRAYYGVGDTDVRGRLYDVVQILADQPGAEA